MELQTSLKELFSELTVGETQSYQQLALFPLVGAREAALDFLLLDEALELGVVRITGAG